MAEEQKKPKRKYTRRQPAPVAVYSVLVTVKRGKKVETIYGESAKAENGCLVVVSMDGPPPLIEKVRYIPLGDAEITVCQRQTPMWAQAPLLTNPAISIPTPIGATRFENDTWGRADAGPRIEPGPLELLRHAQKAGPRPAPVPRQTAPLVERNADGVAVVSAGFGDERLA